MIPGADLVLKNSIRDHSKSKETSMYVAIYVVKNLLATQTTSTIATIRLFIQIQFQLGNYIHAYTNETH